jgi:heme/copper-type cytochrome/quinol oxidase subunit 1
VARYSAAFVWAALGYFTVGILMGAAMAVDPRLMGTLRVAHAHVNLLGWVSMFISGVAYHVLPRFTGQPLHSPRLAEVHVVLANVGLIGLAVAFAAQGAGPYVAFFGVVEAVSGLLFVYNVGRTLLAARPAMGALLLLQGPGRGRELA